jgi:hypothetical protein
MRIRVLSVALVSAALAACSGDSTGPISNDGINEVDAAAVARTILSTGVGVARDGAAGAPAAARRNVSAAGSGTFSFAFDTTEPCQPTGDVDVAGTLSGSWNETALTASLSSDLSMRHNGCAVRTEQGGIITLDGDPDIDVLLTATAGPQGLTALRLTESGAFNWSKGDGNSGRCTLDLTAELITGTQNVRLSGTFCGFSVDVTGPLED